MTDVYKDRVRETTTTTGTGTLTLAGAVAGRQAFSTVGNGNTCRYTIEDANGTGWEMGRGTVGAGTLARTTIFASSAAGAAITLSAGTHQVFLTPDSTEITLIQTRAGLTSNTFSGVQTINSNLLISGRAAVGDSPVAGQAFPGFDSTTAYDVTVSVPKNVIVLNTLPDGYFTQYCLFGSAIVDLAADTPDGYVYVTASNVQTAVGNTKDLSGITAANFEAIHQGTGTVDEVFATYNTAKADGVTGVVGLLVASYNILSAVSGSVVDVAAGVYVASPISSVCYASKLFGVWIADQNSVGATNPYAFWYDSPGVYRIKGDGVMAYYNPTFTKYIPGAANYERVVQQWNSNVLEYGVEKGGTGTLRALRLIGASVETAVAFSALSLQSGTVSSATGALKLAHASSAFLTTLQAGNAAAARTYTWPTNFGAAGTALTDAAGDGTLSWAAAGAGDMVLASVQTVTGAKTFGTIGGAVGKLILAGSTSGSSILNAAAIAGSTTITLPGVTDTVAVLGTAQTFTGVQQFGTVGGAVGKLTLAGSTSGTSILNASAIAGTTTITLPGVTSTLAILGANTFTALQTITQASANAGILASTGYSLTGSDATGMIDLAGTWNTSGNPIALKIAMTNTASGATSKFASWLAGAGGTTEVFSVQKSGAINVALGSTSACSYSFVSDANTGMYSAGADNIQLVCGGNASIGMDTSQVSVYAATAAPTSFALLNSCTLAFGTAGTKNTFINAVAAATLQQGAINAASPVAQILQAQGSRAGTDSNVGGANYNVRCGAGTGTGTLSVLALQSPIAVASGTGAQTQTTGLAIKAGGAVLTSYTVATLPAAATIGAGGTAFVTDALGPVVFAAVVGGGAVQVPVYSDGAAWFVG